jgi:hypothetical protein
MTPGGDRRDLAGDGLTTPFDLGLLIANWGLDGLGDINLDGAVDGRDLGLMLSGWSLQDP